MQLEHAAHHPDGFLVEIGLCRDELSGEWFAEKLAFHLGEVRNRMTFARPLPLERAFTDQFLDGLRRYLPSSLEQSVHVDARGMIELPHLVLGGIRIVTHAVMLGLQKVTVRFKRAFGMLQAFLLPEHRTASATETALHHTAVDALLTVLQPCLDLVEVEQSLITDETNSEIVARRLKSLSEKKSELSFFAYMLQRFLTRPIPPERLEQLSGPSAANRDRATSAWQSLEEHRQA
ncbi:hypothetical protein [Salipiger sp.]|uniref:hypothetical protein n=1 Tax=Salipiger sp. TaxID=2078585 RepID=UPI003A9882A4